MMYRNVKRMAIGDNRIDHKKSRACNLAQRLPECGPEINEQKMFQIIIIIMIVTIIIMIIIITIAGFHMTPLKFKLQNY